MEIFEELPDGKMSLSSLPLMEIPVLFIFLALNISPFFHHFFFSFILCPSFLFFPMWYIPFLSSCYPDRIGKHGALSSTMVVHYFIGLY